MLLIAGQSVGPRKLRFGVEAWLFTSGNMGGVPILNPFRQRPKSQIGPEGLSSNSPNVAPNGRGSGSGQIPDLRETKGIRAQLNLIHNPATQADHRHCHGWTTCPMKAKVGMMVALSLESV